METWKLDRMYTWLMSGIDFNTDNRLLFLVDKKEKVLFNLTQEKNGFGFRKYLFKLSEEDVDCLKRLKSRFQYGDLEILIINKS